MPHKSRLPQSADVRDKSGRLLPRKALRRGGEPVPYDHLDRYVQTIRLTSVSTIRKQFDKLSDLSWVFRGQSDSRWRLSTSLERFVGVGITHRGAERLILDRFKRRAHLYAPDVPAVDDDLAWVSLMQHHGGPTRLLDFTTSPWIALYFAVETVAKERTCAVWAVNRRGCDERAFHRIEVTYEWDAPDVLTEEALENNDVDGLLRDTHLFRKLILDNRFSLVCSIQPRRDNLRMAMQQGIFLCPGNMSLHGFEANLLNQFTGGKDPEYFLPVWNPPQIYKVVIPGSLRRELLDDLKRMNIGRASLFPGLDGFAHSMRFEV